MNNIKHLFPDEPRECTSDPDPEPRGGCAIWGFEPKVVEDCPEIGSARCPCTCGLFENDWPMDEDKEDFNNNYRFMR